MTEQNKLEWETLSSDGQPLMICEYSSVGVLGVFCEHGLYIASVEFCDETAAHTCLDTLEDAKSWCISTAKQILTEALENLNKLEEG